LSKREHEHEIEEQLERRYALALAHHRGQTWGSAGRGSAHTAILASGFPRKKGELARPADVVGSIYSVKTSQRQEEKRKEQLELIEQQIKDGTLVVRKMTKAERAKFPPRTPEKGRPRGRRPRAR
jgi:hypothetical protein